MRIHKREQIHLRRLGLLLLLILCGCVYLALDRPSVEMQEAALESKPVTVLPGNDSWKEWTPRNESEETVSASRPAELLEALRGEPRPAPQVVRGRNLRRVFDEPAVRNVEAADTEPLRPFTGSAPLRLDARVSDHHLSVSALALGISYETFRRLPEQESPRIVIPLEKDLTVTFRVRKIMNRGPVTHSYFGIIEDHPESIAQLVYNDGAVAGHFVLYSEGEQPTRHYEIRGLTGDVVAVHKLDVTAFRETHEHHCGLCAMASDGSAPDEHTSEWLPAADVPEHHADDGRVVDLVVGYSRDARQSDGGVAHIEARMIAAVDRMNQAFENSLIDGRLVLLGMIEDPEYEESDYTMSETLYALRAGWHPSIEEPLETVRAFRMDLGADFASFIIENGEYAGFAYTTHWASVSERRFVNTTQFVFEHELGHNLGAFHAWADTSRDLNVEHARYGWRFRRADGSNRRRSSLDNFRENLTPVYTAGNAGAFTEHQISLSHLSPGGAPVTFRIYTRSPNSADTWHRTQINRVEITGVAGEPPEEDAYDLWAAANGMGAPTDLTDGVPNLLRYALGGEVDTPAETFRLVPEISGDGLRLRFPRVDDPALIYEVWATDDLLDWGATPFWSGGGGAPAEVSVPAPGSRLYLHLRVRRP